MWWKIYFWTMIILGSFGILLTLFSEFNKANLVDALTLVLAIIESLGLYAYVFRKSIFTPQIWKYFFWILITQTVLLFIQTFNPTPILSFIEGAIMKPDSSTKAGFFIGLSLELPIYYAIYQLSKNKNKKSH